jgi:hypothetical protein
MPESLTEVARRAWEDLLPHRGEFDAIVCAGDMHGAPIAGAIASVLETPLMIVCTGGHDCCVSHIVTIGECTPDQRYLYVDDFYEFGASRARTFAYMNQSKHSPVVATYAVNHRNYERIPNEPT